MRSQEGVGENEPFSIDDLPAPVARLARDIRKHMAGGYADSALWSRIVTDLTALLTDEVLRTSAKTWPDTGRIDGKPSNLLLYRDPDYGFVFNAQVLRPCRTTRAHDHGESWSLYGVVEGGERIEHFKRRRRDPDAAGPKPLEPIGVYRSKPGFVDVVPPGHIHRKTNGDHRTVNLVIRSHHLHAFRRYRYDPRTGDSTEYGGPVQIPFRPA